MDIQLKTIIVALVATWSAVATAEVRAPTMPSDEAIQRMIEAQRGVREQAQTAQPVAPPVLPEVPNFKVDVPDVSAAPVDIKTEAPGTARRERLKNREAPPTSGFGTLPAHLQAPSSYKPMDLNDLVKQYNQIGKPLSVGQDMLYLFASLSIPSDRLKPLLESAAAQGATVVFRGGADESDLTATKLTQALLKLRPERLPKIQINPPMFTRFRIATVPAWVIALQSSAQVDEAGCSPPGAYASVFGDVTAVFALEIASRRAPPEVAASARGMLAR